MRWERCTLRAEAEASELTPEMVCACTCCLESWVMSILGPPTCASRAHCSPLPHERSSVNLNTHHRANNNRQDWNMQRTYQSKLLAGMREFQSSMEQWLSIRYGISFLYFCWFGMQSIEGLFSFQKCEMQEYWTHRYCIAITYGTLKSCWNVLIYELNIATKS